MALYIQGLYWMGMSFWGNLRPTDFSFWWCCSVSAARCGNGYLFANMFTKQFTQCVVLGQEYLVLIVLICFQMNFPSKVKMFKLVFNFLLSNWFDFCLFQWTSSLSMVWEYRPQSWSFHTRHFDCMLRFCTRAKLDLSSVTRYLISSITPKRCRGLLTQWCDNSCVCYRATVWRTLTTRPTRPWMPWVARGECWYQALLSRTTCWSTLAWSTLLMLGSLVRSSPHKTAKTHGSSFCCLSWSPSFVFLHHDGRYSPGV